MAVTYNIKGTTNSSFKVGKSGTGTVYLNTLSADDLSATGNLTISGNLVVSGTTTTVNSTTIEVKDRFIFEGATTDAHETTLIVEDPTADRTITIPNATTTLVGRDTTDTLTNKTLTSPLTTCLNISDNIVFEGATADAHELTLAVADPTTDRTITLPDETGIVIVKDAVTGMIQLPVRTTAERPTPSAGMLRFNSTTKRFEGYNGINWTPLSSSPNDLSSRDGTEVDVHASDFGNIT